MEEGGGGGCGGVGGRRGVLLEVVAEEVTTLGEGCC